MAARHGYTKTILYILRPKSTGKRQKVHVAETHHRDKGSHHRRMLCGVVYRTDSNVARRYNIQRLIKSEKIALKEVTCSHCRRFAQERYPQRIQREAL